MKKLLALILSALLLFSLIGTAGAAFADADKIDHRDTEAVEILSALKVVSGFPDGSFKPTDTLTRAQAAKILCTLLGGGENMDAVTASKYFTDVPQTHWAVASIGWCAAQNILAGVGGGKFDPDGKLSAPAFGKMLLVALGADAKPLTGADWEKNTLAQLAEKHLDYGVEADAKTIDRQSACRLALNALFFGEKEADEGTLAFRTFGVKRLAKGTDENYFKRPTVIYSSAKEDAYWKGKDLTVPASPFYIKESGMITGGEGVKILGVSDVVKTDLKVVRNGINGNVKNDVFTDVWHTGNTEPYYLSLDGVRLEFYANPPKGNFTILHISNFCGRIESVKEPVFYADGTVAEPGSIFVHSAPTGVVNAYLYYVTDDFTAADVGKYVLYRGNGGSDGWLQCTKISSVDRGTIVTGKLTGCEPGVSVTIDGKTYPYPDSRFVAMPAERYLRTGELGDAVNILLDESGFCYAVWKK